MHDLGACLRAALGPQAVRADESLARYTAFRIGGPADLLIVAKGMEALRQAVTAAQDLGVPYRVLGGGSNVLISDAGIRGLVILNRAKAITFRPAAPAEAQTPTQPGVRSKGGKRTAAVKCESGASLSTLAQQCVARGFGGLEWAAGIPGTVGGAVVGNAGAWGGDVATVLTRATVLQEDGKLADWPVGRFEYGYRTSLLKQQETGSRSRVVVLEAEFELEVGEQKALNARMAEILAQRKATQPPGATCGSVFKNPTGDHAGRLIDAAGLKGQRRGGAEISPVHANFIVNRGDATAADVKALIDLAYGTVRARFDVALELEIELIGEWAVEQEAQGQEVMKDWIKTEKPGKNMSVVDTG